MSVPIISPTLRVQIPANRMCPQDIKVFMQANDVQHIYTFLPTLAETGGQRCVKIEFDSFMKMLDECHPTRPLPWDAEILKTANAMWVAPIK